MGYCSSTVTKTTRCKCCFASVTIGFCLLSCPQRKDRHWEAPSRPSRSCHREILGCVSSGGQNRMRKAKKTWTVKLGTSSRNDTLMPLTETWTSPDRWGCFLRGRAKDDCRAERLNEEIAHLISHINETSHPNELSV